MYAFLPTYDPKTYFLSVNFRFERSSRRITEGIFSWIALTSCIIALLIQVREKSFREMKKDVGMTTAQKSKETRRMEMGSIFVLYAYPANNPYINVHYCTII